MNTVGKKGKLGEHIRCVVSVAMLTEGWDANTVTHILGIRPFRSQLLCEQVVGRGLRRRSYAVERRRAASSPSTPRSTASRSRSSRATSPHGSADAAAAGGRGPRARPSGGELAIDFPKLDGYRVEMPDEQLHADFDERLGAAPRPSDGRALGRDQGVVGAARRGRPRRHPRRARRSRSRSRSPSTLVERQTSSPPTTASSGRGCSRSSSTICRAVARRVRHDRARASRSGYLLLDRGPCRRGARRCSASIVRQSGAPRRAGAAADPAPLRLRRARPTTSASSPARS